MPPPREPSAEPSGFSTPIGSPDPIASDRTASNLIAASIDEFFARHPEAAVLEDGKVVFNMPEASYTLDTSHGRCTLHLWNGDRNLVRRIVSTTPRADTLRLETQRLGQPQGKLLELVSTSQRRTPTTRDTARRRYVPVLERALQREFVDWKPAGFRTAMDLERSFGPAYARGSLLRGSSAWAVIGVNDQESSVTIDGVLTLGILWLHHCRAKAGGRRIYQGLKVVVPRGSAMLTLSRLGWLNNDAAQWELYELDQVTEELIQRDAQDHGNLRTRLVHHPDQSAAAERFSDAIAQVLSLVPVADRGRVEPRLRNTAELAFLLHGLEFARARMGLAANSFAHTLQITVGTGAQETPLTATSRDGLAAHVAELFQRRRAVPGSQASAARDSQAPASEALRDHMPALEFSNRRRIGPALSTPAHSRMPMRRTRAGSAIAPQQDPLYRAAPERWLESVLRTDLKPLTQSLGPATDSAHTNGIGGDSLGPGAPELGGHDGLVWGDPAWGESERRPESATQFANEPDPDTIGNRADPPKEPIAGFRSSEGAAAAEPSRIARLDPRHVYTQVPAISGASDRGLLDLLGVTADGRLAVIELKADDDLHFALQGLDYWIRVRHHHLQQADAATGMGEFQRHGYFLGVELSPLPPRLYLVAPALHIHPATETILRYLSPRVEWNLLALDERWRQQIKVVWRKHGGLQP